MKTYRKNEKNVTYWSVFIPLIFLCLISSVFIGSSILFIFKVPITKVHIMLLPILCMVIIKKILEKDDKHISWKEFFGILVLFYIILGVLASINNFIWDFSYDSRSYHQIAIMKLNEGWNPFYQPENGMSLWVNHYAKAPWIFATTIYKITGHIEYGKVLTTFIPMILTVVAFGITYRITKGKKFVAVIIALALGLNPVSIGQVFTYYVDSLLGCYIIILIMLVYSIIFIKEYKWFQYFVLFNVIVFMCNIKFTGVAYAGAILVVYFIYILIVATKKEKINVFLYLFISFVITIGIVGFNPYVTNTVNKGNPFYPLAGDGKEDIMTQNTPENYRGDTEFGKLLKSIIAKPDSDNEMRGYRSSIKGMIKIDRKVLKYYSGVDSRLRGFGLYSVIFIPIALVLMFFMTLFCKNKKLKFVTLGLIIATFAIMMYGGEYWWARYVAFMWMIPVAVSLALAKKENKIIKSIGIVLALVLIFNSSIIIPCTLYRKVRESERIKRQLFQIENNTVRFSTKDEFLFTDVNKANEFNINCEIYEEQ